MGSELTYERATGSSRTNWPVSRTKERERERETEAYSDRKQARGRNDKYSSTVFRFSFFLFPSLSLSLSLSLTRYATKIANFDRVDHAPETRRPSWNVETLQMGFVQSDIGILLHCTPAITNFCIIFQQEPQSVDRLGILKSQRRRDLRSTIHSFLDEFVTKNIFPPSLNYLGRQRDVFIGITDKQNRGSYSFCGVIWRNSYASLPSDIKQSRGTQLLSFLWFKLTKLNVETFASKYQARNVISVGQITFKESFSLCACTFVCVCVCVLADEQVTGCERARNMSGNALNL